MTATLRTKLLPGEVATVQSERPPGGSLEAYNAMLQGRFYALKDTEADTREAIDYYTQATQLDSRYALAWSRLSIAWIGLAEQFVDATQARAAYGKAREAAERALALAPDLALAHSARGSVFQTADFNWPGAEAEYRRALALAPNDGEMKFVLGSLLASYGKVEQAIDLTRKALATDPLHSTWYNYLAEYLLGLDRLDEAEQAVQKAIELQPASASNHYTLTLVEIRRGHAQAALEAAQQENPGAWRDVSLALARQIGGDQAAADAALRTMVEKYADVAAYQIAQIQAARNDADATFEWLDRAWGSRDPGISTLLYDPLILKYKDDPRFAAFCRKVGLPAPAHLR